MHHISNSHITGKIPEPADSGKVVNVLRPQGDAGDSGHTGARTRSPGARPP